MTGQVLSEREQEILSTVVRTHIATGAAVPSAAVARRYGRISSATVRNIMGKLERAGFLRQPHTSAGRVPTLSAYDLFARRMAAEAKLTVGDRARIDGLMTGQSEAMEDLLERAPHALSECCRGVGLVVLSPMSQTVLVGIRFVLLSDQRVLVVAEARSGLVRDKVVRTSDSYTAEELERMSAYLNGNFRGWTLEAIRREMERRVSSEKSRFLRQALALCEESFAVAGEPASLHVEGIPHLLEQVGKSNPEALRNLLQTLEEKERLARFLEDCVEGPEAPLRILVGLQGLSPAMREFTLIGKSYGEQAHPWGWLGLLGPARMDYARAITAVRYVAGLIDRGAADN